MTERIEPVAWRKVNPAFAAYDGNGYVPVSHLWTDDPNTDREDGWVSVYTAEQIREMVERALIQVAGSINAAIPPNDSPSDQAQLKVCHAVATIALDAILAQLDTAGTDAVE